ERSGVPGGRGIDAVRPVLRRKLTIPPRTTRRSASVRIGQLTYPAPCNRLTTLRAALRACCRVVAEKLSRCPGASPQRPVCARPPRGRPDRVATSRAACDCGE